MRDVNVVLREKEMDIVRIRREIEALRFAIPLLSEDRPLADDETSELQPPKFLATGMLEGKAGGDDSPSCLAKLHVYPGSTLYGDCHECIHGRKLSYGALQFPRLPEGEIQESLAAAEGS